MLYFPKNNNQGLFLKSKIKVILAPHYDDFILSLGGLADIWQVNDVEVENIIVFSLTNYLNNRINYFNDLSENIPKISALKHQEELKALSGLGKINVRKFDFPDASARCLKKLVGGNKPLDFSQKDREIINNLAEKISLDLNRPIQLFIPLAIRYHQDHLLIRQAFLSALSQSKNRVAEIFFYEDLPYADTNRKEWRPIKDFIRKNELIPITYPINLKKKLALIEFYPSQIDKTFYTGLIRRALKLAFESLTFKASERVYYWPDNKIVFK